MVVRALMLMALPFMFWACSGDEPKVTEPVVADNAAAIPDSPGNAVNAAIANNVPSEPIPATPEPSTTPELAPAPANAANAASMATVKPSRLNVRKGPGMKNPVVRVLKGGDKVSTHSCTNGWCKIGEGEYVSKKFLAQ